MQHLAFVVLGYAVPAPPPFVPHLNCPPTDADCSYDQDEIPAYHSGQDRMQQRTTHPRHGMFHRAQLCASAPAHRDSPDTKTQQPVYRAELLDK